MKSKKILSLLMSLSILGTSLFMFAPNVQAASSVNNIQANKNVTTQSYKTSSVWGTVNADVLNVREGPGTNYGIITKLPHGTRVLIIDSVPGWSQIHIRFQGGNLTGWVASEYVSVYE